MPGLQRLSGLDASFLYLETAVQPLHVCSILELDTSTMPGGYTFDRLREHAQDFSVDIDRRLAAAVVPPDDFIDRAIDIQCGKGKLGLTNPLVPVSGLAPKKTHRLATGKFASKIHCAAQHLRHVDRKASRDARLVQCREDRAFDHCLARERHHFRVWLQHACDKFLTKDRFNPHPIVN